MFRKSAGYNRDHCLLVQKSKDVFICKINSSAIWTIYFLIRYIREEKMFIDRYQTRIYYVKNFVVQKDFEFIRILMS